MNGEYVKIEMIIEKVFNGSEMRYEAVDGSDDLSEKFLKILREEYDIELGEYSGFLDVDENLVGE